MPINNLNPNTVTVVEDKKNVIVYSPGPQGPRGKTILNGEGAPSNNLGFEGDFYLNTLNNNFYGPKPSNTTWVGARMIDIATTSDLGTSYAWEMAQIQAPNSEHSNVHWLEITHNLGFYPNVTIKNSAGDVLETGIDYNSINKITLLMAQPFAGTAYLS